MSVHLIVSASTATMPLSMTGTLDMLAAATGQTNDGLLGSSVPTLGEWEGTREHSRAITFYPQRGEDARDIHAIAYHLRTVLRQDAVMVLTTAEDVTAAHWLDNGGEHVNIVRADTLPAEDVKGTTVQTEGNPIVDMPNGTRWTTREVKYGTHVQAFI